MLNPNQNNRANTVISQSFIASDFQGYSDPYSNNTQPTSSLNQFVRSKQTSDSGFHHQSDNNQSFGFGNITNNANSRTNLESVSRSIAGQETNSTHGSRNNLHTEQNHYQQSQQYSQQGSQQGFGQQNQAYNRQTQQNFGGQQQQQYEQPALNERYVSPNIVKGGSSRINQQQQPDGFEPYRPPQQNGNFTKPQVPQVPQNYSSQGNSNVELGSVAKRFRLNVSEEFSNSFTLKCVNEPQKSSILGMKKRQREFRKSIQNGFSAN